MTPTQVTVAGRKVLTQKPLKGKKANLKQSSTLSIDTYFNRVAGIKENDGKGLAKPTIKSNSDINTRPGPIPKGQQTTPEIGATQED